MGSLDDFSNFGGRLQSELDQLDCHHDEDARAVRRFVKKKDGSVEPGSLSVYLSHLRKTTERIDGPITDLSEAEFEDHVYELRHSPEYGRGDEPGMSANTVRTLEFTIRDFLSAMTDLDWPEGYEVTDPKDTTVTADEMLKPEDIAALRDGANNFRDIAIIEFLADTGARLTLAGSLRVQDVDLEGDRATYTPNAEAMGLKGADIQAYPLLDATATLRTYLRDIHPRPDAGDVALFHKLPGHGNDWSSDRGALTPGGVRDQILKAAESAGVDKPVNPHNFRHSAITRMVREGFDRSQIEHRVHWHVDTDMWSTYQHIDAEEHNDAIFAAAGVGDSDDDGPDPVRVKCGNCTELIGQHRDFCPNCYAAVSPDARALESDAAGDIAQAMAAVEDMDDREFRAMVMQRLGGDAGPLGHADPSESA